MGARLVLASRTTMFQELEQNAYTACGILPSEAMILSDSTESVIPAYISTKKRRLIIGKPRYVHEMELDGLTKQEIADIIKDDINALYSEYIVTDTPAQPSVKDAPVRSKEYYESVTEIGLPKADA